MNKSGNLCISDSIGTTSHEAEYLRAESCLTAHSENPPQDRLCGLNDPPHSAFTCEQEGRLVTAEGRFLNLM